MRQRIIQTGVIIFALLSFLLSATSLLAQQPYTPIYQSDIYLTNISWSADGNTLVFQEPRSFGSGSPEIDAQNARYNSWHQYQVNTGKLTASKSSPLQAAVTANLQSVVTLAQDTKNNTAIISASPNNRFDAFASQPPAGWGQLGWPLAIVDAQTGIKQTIPDIIVYSLDNFDSGYKLQWSSNSTAFIVKALSLGGDTRIYYCTNFSSGPNKTSVTSITDGIMVNGETIYPIDAFDLSSDGSKLLLEDITSDTQKRLFLWDTDPSSPSQVIIQGKNVIGAAFSPLDRNKIWYIDEDGLQEFNMQTKTTTNLNSSLNSTWADKVWFSPNGKWIALLDNSVFQSSSLYVVEIKSN